MPQRTGGRAEQGLANWCGTSYKRCIEAWELGGGKHDTRAKGGLVGMLN